MELPAAEGGRGEDDRETGALASALGALADRVVVARQKPEPALLEPEWGLDVVSDPLQYRHWIHEWGRLGNGSPAVGAGIEPLTEGPLLSVVVPVYRPILWYLRECVQSVLRQRYRSWELCLCDDGSGDDELTNALAELAALDPRITVTALDENSGISAATNRCIGEGSGLFVVLVDHDDVLSDDALSEIAGAVAAHEDADVVYSDDDKLDEQGRRFAPHFKPDWDPDLLLSFPYLGHLTAVRRTLLETIGGFRTEFDGSQDYDVMLRATELARRVVHVRRVLYHWRIVPGSAAGDSAAKPWAHRASRHALEDALERRDIDARVEEGPFPGAYHVRRELTGTPTVSVVIPFCDEAVETSRCLDALAATTVPRVHEIVLVDTGSVEPETGVLRDRWEDIPGIRVLERPGPLDWSATRNAVAATCSSDVLLFLDNHIEARRDGWLDALLEHALRPETGAVGARLVSPEGMLRHAGVVVGLGAVAGRIFWGMPAGRRGYVSWDLMVRAYSAVTSACMMVRRQVFEEMGGFDEAFPDSYNDVDFCLRLRRAGYRVLFTPHAELVQRQRVGLDASGTHAGATAFVARWGELFEDGDPCYSANLSRVEPWCSARLPSDDEAWRGLVFGFAGTTSDP